MVSTYVNKTPSLYLSYNNYNLCYKTNFDIIETIQTTYIILKKISKRLKILKSS